MSGNQTKTMIAPYVQDADVPMYFTGLCLAKFFKTKKVEMDILRSGRDIAIAVKDMHTGYNINDSEIFTNKEFLPPVFKEAFPVKVADLMNRQVGQNPFQTPDFQANATARALRSSELIENKIKRTIELQCAQMFTTGTVTLVDASGTAIYTINFKPKATHFPTAANAWNTGTATIRQDLIDLAQVIRNDGKGTPAIAEFGDASFEAAINNDDFVANFHEPRLDVGSIKPFQPRGSGGQFRGQLDLGNFKMDIYTVEEVYEDPQTSVDTNYLPGAKVIVRIPGSRFDIAYGHINLSLIPIDQRLLKFLPSRMSSAQQNTDMFYNAWITPDGGQMMGGVGSRPLPIPAAIDRYGCISTGV